MTTPPPIETLVRHARTMLLVDRLIYEDETRVRGETTIRADNPFTLPGLGVPAYVGFELMAQTISAFDGLRRIRTGKQPTMGFLLGCRQYEASVAFFDEGQRLSIEARSLLGEGEMGSFDCRILGRDGSELASAVISVYRPEDPEAFLKSQA